MVLNREQRHRSVSQALERAIIEIEVSHLDFALFQRIGIDCKVVIVSGYLDLSRALLADRMIAAVVSKLQLVGFPAQRQAD